jgi:hypothetical protein
MPLDTILVVIAVTMIFATFAFFSLGRKAYTLAPDAILLRHTGQTCHP